MRPINDRTKDDKFKPTIFKFYYFTTGDTAIVDQINDFFTTRAKSFCWGMLVLYYVRHSLSSFEN